MIKRKSGCWNVKEMVFGAHNNVEEMVLEWKEEYKNLHAYICRFLEIVFVPIFFLSLVISLYFLFLFFLDLLFFSNSFYYHC